MDWRTEYEEWGAWHKKNSKARHILPCFDVIYESNSIGARDVERQKNHENSIFFIGDSFVEGFGVTANDRMSNIVERATGRPSLNFGSSGDLGPVQYYLIYKKFCDTYKHNSIVIGFLPRNDFTDNDPDFSAWENNDFRYRPYYKKVGNSFDIFHKGKLEPGRTFAQLGSNDFLSVLGFVDYSWSGGFWRIIKGLPLPPRNIDISLDFTSSGYFEANEERIDAAYYFIDLIVKEARARNVKVYFLIIPSYSEVLKLRSYSSTWAETFAGKLGKQGVVVIDLAEYYLKLTDSELRSSFLECNGHWSAFGNSIAAKELITALSKKE